MAKPRRYRTFPTDSEPWMLANICPAVLKQSTSPMHKAMKADPNFLENLAADAPARQARFDAMPAHWRAFGHEQGPHRMYKMAKLHGLHNVAAAASGLDSFDIDL